jgi:hypothetical protein
LEIRIIPFQLPTFSNIIDISAGGKHSIILNDKNEILTFGANTVNFFTYQSLDS